MRRIPTTLLRSGPTGIVALVPTAVNTLTMSEKPEANGAENGGMDGGGIARRCW